MRTIHYLMLLCSLIGLTACSSHHDSDIHPYADTPVKFGIGFTARLGGVSRAELNNNFETTWQTGDAIGLFVVKGDAGLQATGNYAHNVKLTRTDDGAWTADAPIFYPNDGQSLHFYAYYPYSGSATNPIKYIFGVAVNQTSATNYNQSNLMLAKTENVVASSNPVSLNFSQALSLLQVEVVKGDSDKIPDFGDNLTLTLGPADNKTLLDWEDLVAPSVDFLGDIVMHRATEGANSNVFRAFVPAQTLSATAKVYIVQSSEKGVISMNYKGVQSATLTAGNVHKYQVTLNPGNGYEVGDVYPHTGNAQGVVFWVNPEDNRHGLIVSLDAGLATWSNLLSETNAVSETNGLANMRTVYESGNPYLYYPAFAWVHAKNGGGDTYYYHGTTGVWYLPAKEELITLSEAYRANPQAFDAILIPEGGDSFVNESLWSSTELNSTTAYYVTIYDGVAREFQKDDAFSIRAIMAF